MGGYGLQILGLLGLAVLGLVAGGPAGQGEDSKPHVTTTTTTHINYKTAKPFAAVTADLEKQLGKFDPSIYAPAPGVKFDPKEIVAKSRASEGSSGLMIFARYDHGALLALVGRKAEGRQYVIGNPLVALQMTQVNLVAGECAPVRLFVYAGDDGMTHVDYDLPSSVFGRFDSPEIAKVAKGLDEKVERLVRNAIAP